jgi:hypothetical protein
MDTVLQVVRQDLGPSGCNTVGEPCITQLLAYHVPEHFMFCHRVMRYNVTAVQTVRTSVWCHIVMLRYLSVRLSVMAFIRKSNIVLLYYYSDFMSF